MAQDIGDLRFDTVAGKRAPWNRRVSFVHGSEGMQSAVPADDLRTLASWLTAMADRIEIEGE